MDEQKTYYEVLEIDETASLSEIRRAYRKLARKYHPDVNPGDTEAEKRFRDINEAYRILTDPSGEDDAAIEGEWAVSDPPASAETPDDDLDWGMPPNGGPMPEPEPIFEPMGGPQAAPTPEPSPEPTPEPPPKQQPLPGKDYTQQVEITLEEAFRGTARILRIGGRRIEVKIPKGADEGTKVRVRNEGGKGKHGGPRGDLYLEIVVKPDVMYSRQGDDLYADLPIDLYTAVLGGEAIVPTFKGRVKLRIPAETQSGRVFRVRGQGMPRLKQPDERGDLYAKVMIQVPQGLTEEEIELFEELADIRGL